MKFLIFHICLLLCLSQTFAQKASPTTLEEYNYVTKGYRMQTEGGLDPKKGYHFNDLFERAFGNYNFVSKALIREQKNEVGAILVIVSSKISQKDYYLCIPVDNIDLLQKYWADISGWEKPLLLAYTQIISIYYGAYAITVHDMDKKPKN